MSVGGKVGKTSSSETTSRPEGKAFFVFVFIVVFVKVKFEFSVFRSSSSFRAVNCCVSFSFVCVVDAAANLSAIADGFFAPGGGASNCWECPLLVLRTDEALDASSANAV